MKKDLVRPCWKFLPNFLKIVINASSYWHELAGIELRNVFITDGHGSVFNGNCQRWGKKRKWKLLPVFLSRSASIVLSLPARRNCGTERRSIKTAIDLEHFHCQAIEQFLRAHVHTFPAMAGLNFYFYYSTRHYSYGLSKNRSGTVWDLNVRHDFMPQLRWYLFK